MPQTSIITPSLITLLFCLYNTLKITSCKPAGIGIMVCVTLVVLCSLIWITVILCVEIRIYADRSMNAIDALAATMNGCVYSLESIDSTTLHDKYASVINRVIAVEANQWIMLASSGAWLVFYLLFFFCIECGSYYYEQPESWGGEQTEEVI